MNNSDSVNGKLNALVVEGGAMRGIFSTGVLDAFIVEKFNPFDICIGVSAGATNIAPYLAEMYQRNFKVYTDYSVRPDFISWKKFVKGGHLVDLDWLWDITIKEVRLDLEKILNSNKEFYIGVTQVSTGEAVYIKPDESNLEELLKASSSIPVAYRKFTKIDGIDYTDGGLSDPIPVIEAYKRGAKNIIVIRSREYDYSMKPSKSNLLSSLYLKKYPSLVDTIMVRAKRYEEAVTFMRNPPEGVKVMEVNPPESFRTKRLTKDISILKKDYKAGYNIGVKLVEKWQSEGVL